MLLSIIYVRFDIIKYHSEKNQKKTIENDQEIVSESSNIMGEVVTSNIIKNNEGKYEIFIPNEWLGKVSYFINGQETIIHHITQDDKQMEVNPILLNINVAKSIESINGDVFLDVNGTSYYTLPQFDFPYSQGSVDAIEYEQFFEGISETLQSFKLIEDVNQLAQIDIDVKCGTHFSKGDANINKIFLKEKKDDILKIIGKPINIEDITFEATGETREIYTYDFGQLAFQQNELVVAIINKERIKGPRGLIIGTTLENVIEAFATDAECSDDYTTVFYRGNEGSESPISVPPYCILYSGEDTKTLSLSCFADESYVEGMTTQQIEQEGPFLEQYTCSFIFNEDDVLCSFSISVGVHSE